MSFKSIGFALVAAAVAAGGGSAAWQSYRHDCCRATDTIAAEPNAPVPETVPDDAALIAAQGYCPVMPDTKLGEMGAPIKLMVAGKVGVERPVFVCCKGCSRKVLADPDKALATVGELKAAVAAGK